MAKHHRLITGLAAAALTVLTEALLFRALIDIGQLLGLSSQRTVAVTAVLGQLAVSAKVRGG